MDSTGGSDVGMQIEDVGASSFPSLDVMGNAGSGEALTISKPLSASHSFFSAGWDSLMQLGHGENLLSRNEPFVSNLHSVGNQAIGGSSSPFVGQPIADARLAYFGNGKLSEAVAGSFSMPEFFGISEPGCFPVFGSFMNDGSVNGMNSRAGMKSQECQNLEDGTCGNSPISGRTRKRSPDSRSSYDPSENNPSKLQGNSSGKSLDASNAEAEKKQKLERNEGANIPKRSTRQAKDNLSGEEAPKEYVHVRARRGQATNSHSLAERIRREKISERMKLLQELVPGCSKITGKAVMLDEIINYVQSLQQQVEFLSMKLSTLIPDICFDAGKPLPVDINSQHTAQYLSLSQLPLDSELHSLYHTGFVSNPADTPKPEGYLKTEQ
ncbi:hypothetical protein MLD38_002028 [Melastoma candidum]|uniref:Uncharacterized protein n=1 Tax=Melastoma candidum TaxID=119954 RepID=A0ACB9SEH7_9MYRT|nr:hypothetical protein MLD38_002028 [Melastoma candidum]